VEGGHGPQSVARGQAGSGEWHTLVGASMATHAAALSSDAQLSANTAASASSLRCSSGEPIAQTTAASSSSSSPLSPSSPPAAAAAAAVVSVRLGAPAVWLKLKPAEALLFLPPSLRPSWTGATAAAAADGTSTRSPAPPAACRRRAPASWMLTPPTAAREDSPRVCEALRHPGRHAAAHAEGTAMAMLGVVTRCSRPESEKSCCPAANRRAA